MDFELSVVIEAPVEAVFDACDRPEEQVRWIGSLVEVRSDPGAAWEPGTRFTQVHREASMEQELEGEILAREPNALLRTRLRHSQFDLESELRFEDLGVRCRLTQSTEVKLRSTMLKVMKGAIRSTVQQRIHDDFERLRVLVEGRF